VDNNSAVDCQSNVWTVGAPSTWQTVPSLTTQSPGRRTPTQTLVGGSEERLNNYVKLDYSNSLQTPGQ